MLWFFFTLFVILCADLAVLSSQVYFSRKLGTFTSSLFLDFLIKSPLNFVFLVCYAFLKDFSYLFVAKFTRGKIHRWCHDNLATSSLAQSLSGLDDARFARFFSVGIRTRSTCSKSSLLPTFFTTSHSRKLKCTWASGAVPHPYIIALNSRCLTNI